MLEQSGNSILFARWSSHTWLVPTNASGGPFRKLLKLHTATQPFLQTIKVVAVRSRNSHLA
jgi:hypothetical protein